MHLCTCIRFFLKNCSTTTNCPPAPLQQVQADPEDQARNNNENIENNADENQEDTPP